MGIGAFTMGASIGEYGLFRTGLLCILIVILSSLLYGCVVYEPVPVPAHYRSSYDRAWDNALGAAEDGGVEIASADRTAGIIQGSAGPTSVTISVTAQADGRVRVEFNTKGPKGQDTGLNERLVRYYNMRMGR
jgi:hypothetical protein